MKILRFVSPIKKNGMNLRRSEDEYQNGLKGEVNKAT